MIGWKILKILKIPENPDSDKLELKLLIVSVSPMRIDKMPDFMVVCSDNSYSPDN